MDERWLETLTDAMLLHHAGLEALLRDAIGTAEDMARLVDEGRVFARVPNHSTIEYVMVGNEGERVIARDRITYEDGRVVLTVDWEDGS